MNNLLLVMFLCFLVLSCGESPEEDACFQIEVGDFKNLLKVLNNAKSCKDLRTPLLFQAMRHSDIDAFMAILEHENYFELDQVDSNMGMAPLHYASRRNIFFVNELLKKGANINARSSDGSVALHFSAARKESADVVKLLIVRGASIDSKNERGIRPIHSAISLKNHEAISILVGAGSKEKLGTGKGDRSVYFHALTRGDYYDARFFPMNYKMLEFLSREFGRETSETYQQVKKEITECNCISNSDNLLKSWDKWSLIEEKNNS